MKNNEMIINIVGALNFEDVFFYKLHKNNERPKSKQEKMVVLYTIIYTTIVEHYNLSREHHSELTDEMFLLEPVILAMIKEFHENLHKFMEEK